MKFSDLLFLLSVGSASKDRLFSLYEKLLLSRAVESAALKAVGGWSRRGTKRIYYSFGQEAGPVAITSLLKKDDYLVPPYRGVAHAIGKGMGSKPVLTELLGKIGGPLEGLGNPGSFTDPELGIFPNCETMGNNFGVAVGMGFEAARSGRVAAVFFGDGASTRSSFYGALNLSALWNLPILWVCEDNKYSLATRYDRSSKTSIAEKAHSFGMKAERLDGNDVFGILRRGEKLVEYARKEKKPVFIELDTYRMVRPSEVDTYWYKEEGEYERWRKRDPVALCKQAFLNSRLFGKQELESLEKEVETRVERDLEEVRAMPVADKEEITSLFLRRENENARIPARPENFPKGESTTVAAALKDVLSREMERNERIILFGEDVGLYGGRRGVSQGFLERFGPERVIDTPLNEELFAGIAIGAAQAGLRPVVEFSHAAFLTLAASDIHRMGFWSAVHLGKFKLPILIRSQFGSGYDEYGEELALSPISAFLNWKGTRMVMPSNAFQAKGLLTAALRADFPVIFFEHRMLYKDECPVPGADFALPLDKGFVAREGKDLTIVAYGYLVKLARETAMSLKKESDIDAEIIDLVSLKPLDEKLILDSVSKTKKVLILDEEPTGAGLCAVISLLVKNAIPDSEIRTLGMEPTPLPFGTRAKYFLPDVPKIIRKARSFRRSDS